MDIMNTVPLLTVLASMELKVAPLQSDFYDNVYFNGKKEVIGSAGGTEMVGTGGNRIGGRNGRGEGG